MFLVKYGMLVDQMTGQKPDAEIAQFVQKGIDFQKPKDAPQTEHVHDENCNHDHFEVIKHNEGTGELCPKGAMVKVHYEGTLTNG